MSLLIDALRKAEQDREKNDAPDGELANLSLEPMTRPADVKRATDEADNANRQAAANLFAVKEASAPHNRLTWFALAGVLAGIVLAAYVWWQMQPGANGLAVRQPSSGTTTPQTPPPSASARETRQAPLTPLPLAPLPPADEARALPAAPVAPTPARPQRGSLGDQQPAAAPHAAPPPATPHLTRTTPRPAQVPPDLASAYAAYAAGRLDEAARAYRAHLQIDPNSIDALNGLGAIALQSGRAEEAAAWFRRAMTANPDDPVAQAGLASALPADQPIDDEVRLRALTDKAPDSPEAAFALGNVLARQHRWAEAQEAYFAAQTGDPGNPDYLFNLAVSLDQLAQPALAREFYQRALAAAKTRPAVFDPEPVRARLQALGEVTR